MKQKSCRDCDKWEVCKFKPVPYMGTSSGGIGFTISYRDFASKLFELYGEYCIHYKEDQK